MFVLSFESSQGGLSNLTISFVVFGHLDWLECIFTLLYWQSLLCDPNPNSPANSEAARMFSENKREYNRRVREIVEQSWTADWNTLLNKNGAYLLDLASLFEWWTLNTLFQQDISYCNVYAGLFKIFWIQISLLKSFWPLALKDVWCRCLQALQEAISYGEFLSGWDALGSLPEVLYHPDEMGRYCTHFISMYAFMKIKDSAAIMHLL